MREEFAQATYRNNGPLPVQYRLSGFEAEDREDLVLHAWEMEDENFPAYVHSISEYLELGRWHTLDGEGPQAKLTVHCGNKAINWTLPWPPSIETTLAENRSPPAQ